MSLSHIHHAIKVQNADMKQALGCKLSREQQEQQHALRHVLGETQLSSGLGLAGVGRSTLLQTA